MFSIRPAPIGSTGRTSISGARNNLSLHAFAHHF
jgi:hypothetical protein